MKVLLGLGKVVVVLFWLAVVINLVRPFAAPFAQGLLLAGGLTALVHLAEVALFNARFQARPRPWLDRLQVLLFGGFHLFGMAQSK